MKTYKIALIPGDGIGKDVTEAAWQVLQAAAKRQAVSPLMAQASHGRAPTTWKPVQ